MSIDRYTDYDEIRTALGVSDEELTDKILTGETLWLTLKLELMDIGSTIFTDMDTVKAISSPTADQLAFKELFKIFSTYSVAYQLLDSLPLFSPKTIIEGKSNLTRYSDSPYKTTTEKVSASYLRFKKRLITAYETYKTGGFTAPTPLPLMGVSSPDYDPVTGS